MPVVSEMVHPSGLDFTNQCKVVFRRRQYGEAWAKIAQKVWNRKGERPSKELVRRVYKKFTAKKGRAKYKYANCGRKPWKVSKPVESFLLRRLRALRRNSVCTSAALQRELASAMRVTLETSTIRKVLKRNGYKWLPRAQKRKYSAAVMKRRLAFAKQIVKLTAKGLRQKLSFAMDGVVLSTPPKDAVDRENHCRYGESHMWRKPTEAAVPNLAGADDYSSQVPLSRAVPLWGGVSEGGFAAVIFHKNKKLSADEWSQVVRRGELVRAIKQLEPVLSDGPWHVLCDNESFLNAAVSQAAYRNADVKLWQIPPKSPDLNPVEMFWGWLRRRLRTMDLKDLRAKRAPLGKAAYQRRVMQICNTKKAQSVAASYARRLKKVAQEIVEKKGAAARS